ncbi:MAG: hypothetical protein IPM51_12195 [Sphingobacteriaceae bacterium]|nr:hypothetical protein [Sphingobacteriaceae bacterium]
MNECNKKADQAARALDLFSLPLISQFKVYQFSGRADNSDLVGNIPQTDIQGRSIVVKGIRIVSYYENNSIDLYVDDGGTTAAETIPGNNRINRLFEVYDFGCQLTFFINNAPVQLFPAETLIVPPAGDGNVPLDLDIDNIFYKYPEKIQSIGFRVDARITEDILNNVVQPPLVKVFLQCYIF